MIPCGACGAPATNHPYGLIDLCRACVRVNGAYCVSKLQGLEEDDIRPRYDAYCVSKLQGLEEDDIRPRYDANRAGKTYLCILCGYWHWTSNIDPLPEDLEAAVWRLSRYFQRVNFHINMARGWDKIRYLPREAS